MLEAGRSAQAGLLQRPLRHAQAGVAINAVVNENREDDVLDSSQVRRVAQAEVGTQPRRVQIGGDVGTYLLKADTLPGGSRLIVGVSTHPVDELLAKLLALVAGGTVLGLVAVGVGGTVLIRRSRYSHSNGALVSSDAFQRSAMTGRSSGKTNSEAGRPEPSESPVYSRQRRL